MYLNLTTPLRSVYASDLRAGMAAPVSSIQILCNKLWTEKKSNYNTHFAIITFLYIMACWYLNLVLMVEN